MKQEFTTSRVPLIGDDTSDPIVQQFYEDVRAKGGQPVNLHRTMANAPPMMLAARQAAYAIRYSAVVPRILRELALIRTSQLNGGHYEVMQHRPMAMNCGLSLEQLDSIGNWRDSTLFDEQQRAVLSWVDSVSADSGPSDAEFLALQTFLSDREIVELTFVAAIYGGLSMFTRALHTPLESDAGNMDNPYGKT
jgi:alkylhydroperoxidase family enzyme